MATEFKKLISIGNSKGIIVPKAVLKALQVGEDAKYELRVTGPDTVEIHFLNDRDAIVMKSIHEFIRDYREDLEILAGPNPEN